MAKDSKNRILKIKHLRKGLAILMYARSPYWYVRLRDPIKGGYVLRSTKETSRVEAREAAEEFADTFRSKANSDHAKKKATSFEYYAKKLMSVQEGKSKWSHGDNKLLNRSKDGLICYFGKYDVSKITTGMVRDYLIHLDENRPKRLADSTKSKHTYIISKVLTLAVEDGLLNVLPVMPRQKTKDTPRHAFTDDEYRQFLKVAGECAKRGDRVRGVTITGHHAKMFRFAVHSFLRPTRGELFGLKHKDVQVRTDPSCLELNIRSGKTGKRVSVTMPIAVPLYLSTLPFNGDESPDKNDYVWMPEYPNRQTAINKARFVFDHILEKAGPWDDDRKLTPYSLRHYAFQARLRSSNGKVGHLILAKNAGTSVDQLERFYLKNMAPTKELIENLQHRE
ncbi:tyrosine-type recombinase/integrase [Ruegeria lacuscaerulensis]|uniref:tyrosine-type recombinase/integrase n=1 Tax=Ruegeria lacuscaerulensis TaxID=55218 RepID=UPI00147C444C|nr:phage integrase SAM-like domain-containing protein [Ruegeria lacuscaerulensis]